MIERVVENWLTNTTEKGFQLPFCHILAAEGHSVIHLTRHCPMEMGKDIIAVAPDGVPCAYQLKSPKGDRVTKSQWTNEIQNQTFELATTRIVHPSITSKKLHRSYLSLLADLEQHSEGVATAIYFLPL